MTQQQRIIELDPFFDRRDNGQPGPALQAMQHQPMVGAYGAPETEQLVRMRPSSTGLRGTLIPKATIGGIPMGTRPHATQDVVVNIDPHIAGQSSTIRLGDVNARNVGQAIQSVAQRMEEPTDIVGLRVQGAAVMHTLAGGARHDIVKQAQAAPQQAQPVIPQPVMAESQWQYQQTYQTAPQPVVPVPVQQARPAAVSPRTSQPQRQISPLMALNQRPPAQAPVRGFRDIEFHDEPPPQPAAISAPQVKVLFEVEHFGKLDVNYHDVIIENGFMVLVFDTRYQGAMKYFPPVQRGETQPRMAASIVGTNEVYGVQTTGVQFEHDEREFCVLAIDEVGALEQ